MYSMNKEIKQMELLTVTITSKIDKPLDKLLIAYGNSHDWEKSKAIRNILRSFLLDEFKNKTTNV